MNRFDIIFSGKEKINILRTIFFLLCLVFGTFLMFWKDNYGGVGQDEIYQTLCVRNFKESPIALLTFYIGHLWTEWFGFSVLNLRYLTSLGSTIAVAISTFFLVYKRRNLIVGGIGFLAGCILMKSGAFQLYNWDSGTYAFDALALCLLLSILDRPTLCKYIILGMSIGLMTMGRMPSCIFLPFSLVIILLSLKGRDVECKTIMGISFLIAFFIITFFLISTLILGTPHSFFSILGEGKFVSGHSPFTDRGQLFRRLLFIINNTTTVWAPATGCMLLAVLLPYIKRSLLRVILVLGWLFICLLLIYYNTPYRNQEINLGCDTPVGFGLLLAIPIFFLFHKQKGNLRLTYLKLFSCAFLYISMAFGSDAYIERCTTAFTIPVLICILLESRILKVIIYLKYSLLLVTAVFAVLIVCHLNWITSFIDSRKNIVELYPFQGIKSKLRIETEIKDAGDAISFLNAHGIKYAVFSNHQLIELVYGANEGLEFHMFNDFLSTKGVWDSYKNEIIPRVGAFVYTLDSQLFDKDRENILNDLMLEGFTDSYRIGNSVIVVRSGDLESVFATIPRFESN